MSENPIEKSAAPEMGVLPAVAALHMLLATRPQLAVLPTQWLMEPGKGRVAVLIHGRDEKAAAAYEELADALGGDQIAGNPYEHRGAWWQARYLETVFGGVEFLVSAHVAVDGPEAGR
ncbi:hypothetical protein ACFCX4_09090 [Kitasatospora sp. NPDC056327]|uniref:hypothetical protein n=1 Tax=Kitasatospora sp. NPDC056327 TaxID=3345785 RepID=UPI0035DF3F82